MPEFHSRRSPSGAEQWSNCTASVHAIEEDIRNGDLEEEEAPQIGVPNPADEGTAAHTLLSNCLTTDSAAEEELGEVIEVINGVQYRATKETCENIDRAIAYVNSLRFANPKRPMKTLIEQRVNIPQIAVPEEEDPGGTADVILYSASMVIVLDYKNGYGYVPPKQNKQCMLYLYGAVRYLLRKGLIEKPPKKMYIGVMQPRVNNMKPPVKVTASELKKFMGFIDDRCREGDEGGVFRPGDKTCKWCRRAGYCKPRAKYLVEQTRCEFEHFLEAPSNDKEILGSATVLSDEELAELYVRLPLIQDWIKTVQAHVLKRMLVDKAKLSGLKVVRANKNRKWTSNEETIRYLLKCGLSEEQAAPRKVIGITEANRILPKNMRKGLDDYITKPQGGPEVALETDIRPAFEEATTEFNEYMEE